MWTQLWSGLGGKIADRWISVAVPALIFWMGGLAAYALGKGTGDLVRVTDNLAKAPLAAQLIWLVLALLAVQASALLIERVTLPVLRLIEGYWPRWLGWLAQWRIKAIKKRLKNEKEEWQTLAALPKREPGQSRRMGNLDERRRHFPDENRLLPTKAGNRIRAAEDEPGKRYGLNAIVVWGHLWLVLPESAKTELTAARSALNQAVSGIIWCTLFVLFGFWTPWAIVAGLAGLAVIWTAWLPVLIDRYAILVQAAFDLNRFQLYKAVHWDLPATPADEPERGAKLTGFLYRGEVPDDLRYHHPS